MLKSIVGNNNLYPSFNQIAGKIARMLISNTRLGRITASLLFCCGLLSCSYPLPSPTSSAAVNGQIPLQAAAMQTEPVQPIAAIPAPPPLPLDLIAKISAGLALPDYDHPAIDQQLSWHQRNPAYLQRVWKRSRPYLHYVVSEIERRGLPMELALLPIVESGYQPYGYSHARAAGLWQFIPSTGRMFGLNQTWWSDQRRDVTASTDAALDYLQQLHKQFKGDWLMAIASYNAGAGRVSRQIRVAQKSSSHKVHFSDLSLSSETAAYVPKLLALARVVKHAEQLGIELPVIIDQPYFEIIELGQQTDLGQISRLAKLDADELRKLNPSLNRWATDPQGPHRILVPVAAAEGLRIGLQSLADDERISWQRHLILPGDNLGSIARQYGTTVAVLQQSNQINNQFIRAGRYLLIPSAAALPMPLAASCRGQRLFHQVKSGDTLWDLSRHYQVSVNHLKRCNPGLSAGTLALNSLLRVRDPQPYAIAPGPPSQQRVDSVVNYKVRRGDSLAAISTRFGVSVNQLVGWNKINPNEYLQPGDRLIVRLNLLDQT
ncbi:MAG: LysM peptidoglycan-binding domain-containing protein [Immundisolibacteraceae bacterium]|nr:LysM peptidoglycan-binding domain-containing protein [Immundisolibacteraceae bacterium]